MDDLRALAEYFPWCEVISLGLRWFLFYGWVSGGKCVLFPWTASVTPLYRRRLFEVWLVWFIRSVRCVSGVRDVYLYTGVQRSEGKVWGDSPQTEKQHQTSSFSFCRWAFSPGCQIETPAENCGPDQSVSLEKLLVCKLRSRTAESYIVLFWKIHISFIFTDNRLVRGHQGGHRSKCLEVDTKHVGKCPVFWTGTASTCRRPERCPPWGSQTSPFMQT